MSALDLEALEEISEQFNGIDFSKTKPGSGPAKLNADRERAKCVPHWKLSLRAIKGKRDRRKLLERYGR